MDRNQKQSQLVYELGLLLSPLIDVADNPQEYDAHERSRRAAKFHVDASAFSGKVSEFASSEPGYLYNNEVHAFRTEFNHIYDLVRVIQDPAAFSSIIHTYADNIRQKINAFPPQDNALILEAHTPFSTYCRLNDIFQTASHSIILADPYLTRVVFYRYLRDIPLNVKVTLITHPDAITKQPLGTEFMDISRLYASERGASNYSLITEPVFHDRTLRIDDRMYNLGGSIKDAGKKSDFTLAKLDPTSENKQRIDSLLIAGKEIFGLTQPNPS